MMTPPSEEVRAAAQAIWDAIEDDDTCCIGHPEGAEFIEEAIVPKIATWLAQQRAEAALAEAKWWHDWGKEPANCGRFCLGCKRLAALAKGAQW